MLVYFIVQPKSNLEDHHLHWDAPVVSLSVQSVVLLRTWFTQQAQPEVNIVLLVCLSVLPVCTHIDHRLPTHMEQKTCDGHLVLQLHDHPPGQELPREVEEVGVVEHDHYPGCQPLL